MSFKDECTELKKALARHGTNGTVLVIGSTEEWIGDDSNRNLCTMLGNGLGALNVSLLTGGTTGVPRIVERGFAEFNHQYIVRVLPTDHKNDPVPTAFGTTLILGANYEERRCIIGQCCDLVILVAGGPGAAHEAAIAHEQGIPVLMVPSTGGAAAGHEKIPFPKRKEILRNAKKKGMCIKAPGSSDKPGVVAVALVDLVKEFFSNKAGSS